MNHNTDENKKYIERTLKSYGELNGALHLVKIERDDVTTNIGLSLVGNRDLATMSVFVVGIQPASVAADSGLIRVGDELLEINGQILYGRSHLNSSALIKSITSKCLKILLLRSEDFLVHMAISPSMLANVEYKEDTSTLIPKKSKSLSTEDAPVIEETVAQVESSTCETKEPQEDYLMSTSFIGVRSEDIPEFNICSPIDASPVSMPRDIPEPCGVQRPASSRAFKLQKCSPVEDDSDLPMSETSVAVEILQRPECPPKMNFSFDSNTFTVDQSIPPPSDNRDVNEVVSVEQRSNRCRPDNISPGCHDDRSPCRPDDLSPVESSPDSSTHRVVAATPSLDDPTCCAITSGRQTVIEIRKGRIGLGVKIIGGCDTSGKAIVIYEIFKDGAVSKDGRLRQWDQILEINGITLRECSYQRAQQVLLQATSSVVRLAVLRSAAAFYREEEICDFTSVELIKRPGKGLGLSIIERGESAGIIICDVVKGGAAEADGRLCPGDQILVVNGEDIRQVTQEYAAELLKTLMGKVNMTIARLKPGWRPPGYGVGGSRTNSGCGERGLFKPEINGGDCKSVVQRIANKDENWPNFTAQTD